MNDIELQVLRDANRAIQVARDELTKIDAVKNNAEQRLYGRKAAGKRYQALSVAKAMGDDVAEDLPQLEQSEAELRLLIEGLEERPQEQEHELERCNRVYDAKMKETLQSCLTRAAEKYGQQAQDLIQLWKQLDAAQLALGARDLSWIHIFIPALEQMRGSTISHSRRRLFSGQDAPKAGSGDGVEAELVALLS